MRIRHKIPSIFTLSMVDVLCCALGCVILLWLINVKENDAAKAQSRKTTQQAAVAEGKWKGRMADINKEQARLIDLLASLADENDEADRRARSQKEELERLKKALAVAKELEELLKTDHKKAIDKALADLTIKLGNEKGVAVKAKDVVIANLQRELKELRAQVKELDALRTQVKELNDLRTQVKTLKAKLSKLENLKGKEEDRFAGIEMKGKRIIILVDTSGSMTELARGVAAPNKWREVCENVARLMRSLRGVEQFQIITFAEEVNFLLGKPGEWLDFDARAPDRVFKELRRITPQDQTNMYSALLAAFKFRAKGLDTIHLFSDGMPNVGPPLTAKDLGDPEAKRVARVSAYVLGRLKTWNQSKDGKRVRINTIGFYYESTDLGRFLWAMARENDGNFVGMSRP